LENRDVYPRKKNSLDYLPLIVEALNIKVAGLTPAQAKELVKDWTERCKDIYFRGLGFIGFELDHNNFVQIYNQEERAHEQSN
jgi:hypothetical protein